MKISGIFLLLILFFPAFFPVMGQTGILRGKIIDANTGEELIGATVVVEGTTNGTISDFDGNYSLKLDTGVHKIRYSYISYQTQMFEDIHISEGKVTLNNVTMEEARVELEEVKVVARSTRRTEAAFQVMQKKSGTVMDGISAEQISRLDVADAASALKRVTGVSVKAGKYVYVRGLSDRYSLTTLNGAQIPGLDPDKNTVQMDLFPSNIIENLVVRKTFSPDLPGSFTGGYVNIVTRDFPEKFSLQFSASTGYNPRNNMNNHFISYPGGKLDWLAFDDGTRDIPEIAKGQIPARFEDNQKLDEITRSFNKNMEPVIRKSSLDQSYSFGIGNRINLGKKPFGYNIGISYSGRYKYYDNGFTGRYKLIDGADQTLTGQLTLDTDRKGTHEVLWSALVNGNLKLSEKHKIGFLLLHNQSGESMARYQEGEKQSDEIGMYYQTRTLQYLERGFTSGQLKGEHYFDNFMRLKADWFSSVTLSTQQEPDLRFFTNHYTLDPLGNRLYEIAQSLYPVPTRYYRNMDELNLDNSIKAEIPVRWFGSESSKIKAGGDFVYKNRHFREHKFTFNENNNSYTGDIPAYLADSNIDAAGGKLHVINSIASDEQNSYDGKQAVFSAFGMIDLSFSTKFRLISGLRTEQGYIETRSLKNSLQPGILNNLDFLPSLNLTWHPVENMNLRMGYNRTLARPSFRELAPYASLNFVGDYIFIGNADLERTLIDNIDIRWEYFFRPGEMIAVSGFYKNFNNPIERTFNTEAANPELTLRNVSQASVTGVEFELRKKLDFIPLLKHFLIGGNASLVKSSVSVDSKELQLKRELDPVFPATRVMMGQSPYLINAFLNYANIKYGMEINVSFNTSGESLYLVNAVGVPDVYLQPRKQLDVNFAKSFGKNFQVKFSVKNILDDPYKITYPFNGIGYLYESYLLNRTFTLGIRYVIK
ncbi:MAG: TonB-dependent receptor [Chlorobi bacterium]|nr:TonB-dependent receptor [Chlorobiota bacterium]